MMNPGASMDARDEPAEESVSAAQNESGGFCLSVIMVLHNSDKALSYSLPALAEEFGRLAERCKAEALFVDNASANDPTEQISRLLPGGRVVTLAQNNGFGAGCNAGVKESGGEYLFFVNPDVILDPGCIEELMRVLDARSDAWATTGRMRNADGSFQSTCRELPTLSNIFGSRGSALQILRRKNNKSRKLKTEYTLPDYQEITAVPATAGTALLIRRETFDKLGGFDERFFMFMEDTDLSAEIHARGGKIYFCPQAGAVHYWGGGSPSSALNRSRWHHVSVWRYFRKRVPGLLSTLALPLALGANFLLAAFLRAFRKV
jgi:N-acetylglucosaminyl-diphospho-decaprenol L-rhamnosyltransferase